MNDKRTSLEMIENSAEEAITAGLEELGLTEDDVEVEILDLGSRGLFGLGSRQARVRLTIKSADTQEKTVAASPLPMPMPMPMPVSEPMGEPVSQPDIPETVEDQQDPVLRAARETVTTGGAQMAARKTAMRIHSSTDCA